jgi:hypothetical protein
LLLSEDIRQFNDKRQQDVIHTKEVWAGLMAGQMNHTMAGMILMEGQIPSIMTSQVAPDELHAPNQSFTSLCELVDHCHAF